MTALPRLPDDYRRPTSGLEMLTGGAEDAQWRDLGYIDGWNWVANGGSAPAGFLPQALNADPKEKGFSARRPPEEVYPNWKILFDEAAHLDRLLQDKEAYYEGFDEGVRSAARELSP